LRRGAFLLQTTPTPDAATRRLAATGRARRADERGNGFVVRAELPLSMTRISLNDTGAAQ
jgi:hypothetical protein